MGVSAGAINGAFYAQAPGPTAIEGMARLWSSVTTRQIMGLSWRSLLGVLGMRDHLASASALGAQRIIVLPCGFACANVAVARTALGRAMHAITLLGARQLRQDHEHYSALADIHVVPPLCPLSQSAYDYSRGAELIEAGRQSTRSWIEAGGLHSRGFPGQLVEHQHAA